MGVRVLVLSVAFVFVMSLAQEGLAQEAAPTPVADDPATSHLHISTSSHV